MTEPLVLGCRMLVSDQELMTLEGPDDVIEHIYDRLRSSMAYELEKVLVQAKGGAILTPLTFTINTDDAAQLHRVAGTMNATLLPDPETDQFRLIGGLMDGRIIRVGDPAPEFYRIPYIAPLTVYADPGVVLLYKRVRGATAYQFVSEESMPA